MDIDEGRAVGGESACNRSAILGFVSRAPRAQTESLSDAREIRALPAHAFRRELACLLLDVDERDRTVVEDDGPKDKILKLLYF